MQNNDALLSRLAKSEVDFVVVGGFCCVYHGVPVATFDLDICCDFREENLQKLQSAVSDLHPFHRMTPQKLPFVR
ncbi:MAG TPA: nucleotidyltransferase, partial [Verrucomicrobiae bacterium]|nr:nucleotidyltransferase [Verrucomicrobiae bacterium]